MNPRRCMTRLVFALAALAGMSPSPARAYPETCTSSCASPSGPSQCALCCDNRVNCNNCCKHFPAGTLNRERCESECNITFPIG